MQKSSVRALKLEIEELIVRPLMDQDITRRSLGVTARRLNGPVFPRTIALGIAQGVGPNDFRLAVRVQHPQLLNSPGIERLTAMSGGEADVRFVGYIRPLQAPWYQSRCRPLRIGSSVGHFNVTAGTIGAFVRLTVGGGSPHILSNNHVLADENRAQAGDQILQPGKYDNGAQPNDEVAVLRNFVPLDFQNRNLVDCALSEVTVPIQSDHRSLDQFGNLAGQRTSPIDVGHRVRKVGRTTGATEGTVSAIELDDVVVGYDQGIARFDSQIEIKSLGPDLFSSGGDSGSLIFDEDNMALGLLFAGSEQGGSNSTGLTYANPLETVLSHLGATLLY